MTSYNRDYWMAFTAHQKASVGDIKFSAVNYDHLGWKLCDGSSLEIDQFQFLFNMIGYSFGRDGDRFKLPNPGGRVPGVIGNGNDDNTPTSSMTAYLGQSIGEYQHRLTIQEMPSHNHGVDGTVQVSTNKYTSTETTGITTNATGPTTSGGTGYGLVFSDGNNTSSGPTDYSVGEPNVFATVAALNITDLGHRHELNPAGTDAFHNNVQPTLFIGNMFIYTGLPRYGASVYQTGSNLW